MASIESTPPRQRSALEIAVLLAAVMMFSLNILDFDTTRQLPGNESPIFQALDWVFYNSVQQGSFPLWNPYLQSGLPYIADPMLHVYNPVVTLPVLVLGVQVGFKTAVALSFMLAAVGMWRVGRALGFGSATRIWLALMFAFAGQPVARFFQGQYLFIFGFAWIPWVLDNLLRLERSGQKRYLAGLALSLGLLFFSGNAYYSIYTVFTLGIFGLVFVLRPQLQPPYLNFNLLLLKQLLLAGLLSLGIVAIQLLPTAEFWPRIGKSLEVVGNHTPAQIFLDYTSKDTYRPDAFSVFPAREEFYAYIGLMPFLALSLLPFAIWKSNRRVLVFLGLLVLFVLSWAGMQAMPWYPFFQQIKPLLQFRVLLRILIYGNVALLLLAGMSIDAVWKTLEASIPGSVNKRWEQGLALSAKAGLVVLGFFLLAGILDVYQTNRQYVQTIDANPNLEVAARWLRQYDLGEYTVRLNPNNMQQDVIVATGHQFIQVWYHFGDIRNAEGQINARPIEAQPNYILQNASDPAPSYWRVELIQTVNGFNIYRALDSLPYAFVASRQTLMSTGPALSAADVRAVTLFRSSPNRVEVITSSNGSDTLVLLNTHYPGWEVRVDGQTHILQNAGGYLATPLLAGTHKYEFVFRPRNFYVGLAISLVVLVLCLGMLLGDTRQEISQERQRLAALPGVIQQALQRARLGLNKGRLATPAIYSQGRFETTIVPDLVEGQQVQIIVEPVAENVSPLRVAAQRWNWASIELAKTSLRAMQLGGVLFFIALLIYLVSRLWRLVDYPIYFFGDEAVQVLFAERLIANGFQGVDGNLLPMYVEAAGNRWTPLISMYFHALTMTLFGKSIFVSRATSAIVSLVGSAAVAVLLKRIFKARVWWSGLLILGMTPAWFLHSRTAFETVMTAAFFACFLLFYLLYRTQSPKYLYLAIVFGAATFYSYSNAQAVFAALAALLFITDLPYHWQQRSTLLRGLLLLAILAIPLINFRLNRPAAIDQHLKMVGSYWFQAIPLQQKLLLYLQKYSYGLSPQYWFFPNTQDLSRHRMLGIAHIPTALLPFFLIGLFVCVRRIRQPAYRVILLAGLATPVGAAILDIGIARVLAFVIPASILSALGIEWLLVQIIRKQPDNNKELRYWQWSAAGLFALLAWANLALLTTALDKGPFWFNDYGLYGMQWGARQLFEEAIPEYLENDAQAVVLVSSTWANGADNFIRFFIPEQDQGRVRMDNVERYLFRRTDLTGNEIFIMTQSEYERTVSSPKFTDVQTESVIDYPDGRPGFYFVRLAYSQQADAIFAAEKEARSRLLEGELVINGQTVRIRYSQIDMGQPSLMFDNDSFTLMRGMEANPFIIELEFPQPVGIHGLQADFGLMSSQVSVALYAPGGTDAVHYKETFQRDSGDPKISMAFIDAPETINKLRIEILSIHTGEVANIHIRDLQFLP